jgi:hypothetical protein
MVTSLQPSISFGVLLSWNATASTWAAELCVSSFGSKKKSIFDTDRQTHSEQIRERKDDETGWSVVSFVSFCTVLVAVLLVGGELLHPELQLPDPRRPLGPYHHGPHLPGFHVATRRPLFPLPLARRRLLLVPGGLLGRGGPLQRAQHVGPPQLGRCWGGTSGGGGRWLILLALLLAEEAVVDVGIRSAAVVPRAFAAGASARAARLG